MVLRNPGKDFMPFTTFRRPFGMRPGLLTALVFGAMLAFSGSVQAEPASSSQPQPIYPGAPESTQAVPDAAAESAPKDAPAPNVEAEATEEEPAQPKSNVVITIDKESQNMTVFVDGVEQYAWPVSTGIRGYSTPSGSYTVSSMNKIWYSKQWDNAPMPHAIFFKKKGHAIHGTHETKRLGTAASHGCVRLSPKNAETLFTLVKGSGMENVKVVLEGETPGGEAKIAETEQRRYPSQTQPWFTPDQPYADRRRWRRGFFGQARPYYNGAQGYYQAPSYQQQQKRYRRRGY